MSRKARRNELQDLRRLVQQYQQGGMQQGVQGNGSAFQQPITTGATTNKGGFFKDTPGGMMSASMYGPWAQQMMQDSAKFGSEGLRNLTDQKFNFAPIAQQARTNFAQTTIPSIAERFASLGTGGSQRSSAFPQLLSQAGGDLEQQLAALQEQYGLQEKSMNAGIYGQMFGQGLSPQWENMYRPGQQAGYKDVISGLFSGGAKLGAGYLAGR